MVGVKGKEEEAKRRIIWDSFAAWVIARVSPDCKVREKGLGSGEARIMGDPSVG